MLKRLSILQLLLAPISVLGQKTFTVDINAVKVNDETMKLVSDSFDHPSLGANYTVNLKNEQDFIFTSTFYFGSTAAPAQLIYDTGSDWVFVLSEQCEFCWDNHRVYDPTLSKTAKPGDTNVTAFAAQYGAALVTGDDFWDTVCVGSKTANCVKDFRFLAVLDKSNNLRPMDGVIGLGPDDPSNGPCFVQGLKNQSLIDKAMLGLKIGDAGTVQSTVVYGGYDDIELNKTGKSIQWNENLGKKQWTVKIKDFKVTNTSAYKNATTTGAILDSFFTTIALPPNDFLAFAKILMDNYTYVKCDTTKYYCKFDTNCGFKNDELPPLKFQLNDITYTVPAERYTIERIMPDGHTAYCEFRIQTSNRSEYILGQPFLFNYYSVYDYELNRVGLFEHSTSKGNTDDTDPTQREDPKEDNGQPAEDEGSKFPVWVIILLVVVILGVLIALGAYMYIKYRNRKLAGNLDQYNQLESTNTAV